VTISGTTERLTSQITVFPEGQHVAAGETGRVLGSSSTLIIDWDDYAQSARWSEITDRGTFNTHNPLGKTLYGADMAVDGTARRQGIGSLFYKLRKQLVKERGLKRMLTGGRIPGYGQVAGQLTPREYVADVVMGKRTDPTLSFQLANGSSCSMSSRATLRTRTLAALRRCWSG
jgi:GNAT superfamily N-acetyltransferase